MSDSSDSDRDEDTIHQVVQKVGENDEEVKQSFADLGLVEPLCEAAASLGWAKPSKIQAEAIPVALEGKDVIGLAETGSGKTGAFALPMLQALLDKPQRLFGLVLTPTRELAFQIAEQFQSLGKNIGVKCTVLVGEFNISHQKFISTLFVFSFDNKNLLVASESTVICQSLGFRWDGHGDPEYQLGQETTRHHCHPRKVGGPLGKHQRLQPACPKVSCHGRS